MVRVYVGIDVDARDSQEIREAIVRLAKGVSVMTHDGIPKKSCCWVSGWRDWGSGYSLH